MATIDAVEVHITAPSEDQAAAMARTLVEEGLAACVNIVPRVRSVYAWDGRIVDENEVLCLVKTRAELFDALADRVRALHPYQVPEILAFAIVAGNPAYLDWLAAATKSRSSSSSL